MTSEQEGSSVELSVNGENHQPSVPAAEEAVRSLESKAVSLDGSGNKLSPENRRQIQTMGLPPASRQLGTSGKIMAPTEGHQQTVGGVGSGAAVGGGGPWPLQSVRQWGYNAYKCTLQLVSERLGRATRTADLETEAAVAALRESRRRYEALLNLASALTKHFQAMCDTQRVLADAFLDLARQEPPALATDFQQSADSQRALQRSGEQLLVALQAFCTALSTLVNRTFEDALRTVSAYEFARVEFDAHRGDLDALSVRPSHGRTGAEVAKAEELKRQYEIRQQKFEQLRHDVRIKVQFLDENKIRVMQKQLRLFQSAVSAYFSGNQEALEAALRQINIK
ncbi:hypothetical protein BOX15_Mlig023365g1 [Macrostomum lignano]|uniref:AH domain-containing protein n=1 Tax=Macrostomum lignano TaxID=282301 RepID=A0A267F1W9_9PLAT|nr:hypothetical protein BOX15_Mlig023365g1 [Macrostomum lignano]